MDYEKVYKDTINKLQQMVNSGKITVEIARGIYADFVPESEDERIRKEIINFLELPHPQFVGKRDHEKWIAWLEKKSSLNTNQNCLKGIKRVQEYQDLSNWEKEFDNIASMYAYNKNQEGYNDSWYVKERAAEMLYHAKKELEKQPDDKVKPKFKVKKGEWYVCTNTFVSSRGKILAIKGQTYQSQQEDNTITCEDNCLFIDRHDGKASDYFHLWTIQDAKDGDVIVDKSDGTIGIFQSIGHHPDGGSYNDPSYCFLHCRYDDGFFYADFEQGNTMYSDDVIPATKEQRDLLFAKMKEAGYEWDADAKQLKKIEQKPAWSEEDKQYLLVCKNALAKYQFTDKWDANIIFHWLENKLKSLRPRSQWKPSEEQMEALEHFVRSIGESGYASPYDNNTKLLNSLLEQLKKL